MRTVLLNKLDESYLQKCANDMGFAYGLIIGHHAEPDKYCIVHLAKNCEEDVELSNRDDDDNEIEMDLGMQREIEMVCEPEPSLEPQTRNNSPPKIDIETKEYQATHSVQDINVHVLSNQWLSACKMIPGSFEVLGVFVTSIRSDITSDESFRQAKGILNKVHSLLMNGMSYPEYVEYLINTDYLFMAYSMTDETIVCKNYTHSVNGGTFTPVDCRFVEKPFEWFNCETSFEFDEIYPVFMETDRIQIEQQLYNAIDDVRKKLKACEIFIQNEMVDDNQTLDVYVKKKNPSRKSIRQIDYRSLKAHIYIPFNCQLSHEKISNIEMMRGAIRYSGIISSRIWCNPKNTFHFVKKSICNDILRSLVTRIQIHCDALTEANVSNEPIFISEPPRRIYFKLPCANANATNGTNIDDNSDTNNDDRDGIQFSEYIFHGEAKTVAIAQAKQILDLVISNDHIVGDIEGKPEDGIFGKHIPVDVEEIHHNIEQHTQRENIETKKQFTYIIVIIFSIIVLAASIFLHFMSPKTQTI